MYCLGVAMKFSCILQYGINIWIECVNKYTNIAYGLSSIKERLFVSWPVTGGTHM
jgi:hypothetical protein